MADVALVGYVNEITRSKIADFFFLLAEYEHYGILCESILNELGESSNPILHRLEFVLHSNQSEQNYSKIELQVNLVDDTIIYSADHCFVTLNFTVQEQK